MITADLLVKNANIITMDKENPKAEAFACKYGRFIKIGSSSDVEAFAGANTKTIDAGGKTVIPGLIDAHAHLLSLRGKQLLQLDCSPRYVGEIQDIIDIISEKAKTTPKGEWILAGSYDFTKLKEQRHPTRWELDKASVDHPIHLRTQTCHIGVINSKALEVSGIAKDVEDPPGGVFDRDENGELTGVCREEAHFLFVTGMGKEGSFVPPYSREQLAKAVELSCKEYNSMGITSTGDGLVGPEEIEAYQLASEQGKLTVRTYLNVLDINLEKLKALRMRTGFGNEFIKIGGIKSFVDGAIAAHTAWLSESYEGRPDYYGIATKTPEEISEIVLNAHRSGFQMEIHANGDRAIEIVLDAYEKAQKTYPRNDPRHRIAHCTVVNGELIKRIHELGVIPLPFTTYVYEHGEKMGVYGDRINMMFANRSFLDAGIPVAASSDNPCATQNPFLAFYSMVNRKSSEGQLVGPEQRISIEEALWIYTMGSAYASFEEGDKGSIEEGKLADFVVLSEDPINMNPEKLKDIKALETFVNGGKVYP